MLLIGLVYLVHFNYCLNLKIWLYKTILLIFILVTIYFISLQINFLVTNHNFGRSNINFFNNYGYLLLIIGFLLVLTTYITNTNYILEFKTILNFENIIAILFVSSILVQSYPISGYLLNKLISIFYSIGTNKLLFISLVVLLQIISRYNSIYVYIWLSLDSIVFIIFNIDKWGLSLIYHTVILFFFLFSFLNILSINHLLLNYLNVYNIKSFGINFSYSDYIIELFLNNTLFIGLKAFLFNLFNTSILISYLSYSYYLISYITINTSYITIWINFITLYNVAPLVMLFIVGFFIITTFNNIYNRNYIL